MKQIKKVFAILLSLAMILGMSMTTFAAGSANITIKNAGTGATFMYAQVIEPDATTKTGWKFSTTDIETSYLNAYGETDAQVVLKKVIDETDASKTQAALNQILDAKTTVLIAAKGNPFAVSKAGVYAIKGTEDGFAYSSMAAYVAFKDYDPNTGSPADLEDISIEAKRAPVKVEKTNADEDKVLEIGREVTYTISTTVPYIAAGTVNPKYIVKDKIDGAKYVEETAGSMNVKVTVGSNVATDYVADVTGNEFTLDLTDILAGNNNANSQLTITYRATVTDTIIGNTVKVGDGTNETQYGTDGDKLITGEITITKQGDDNELLAGAEFVVYKEVQDGNNTVKNYAKFDANNKLSGWVVDEKEATKVITADGGKVTVQGLDSGITYMFKEVKAPDGYSINATDSVATWGEVNAELTETVKGTASMKDTKLMGLPSTGGIGTTIFTIGGCLIMVIAAALFFASRKKSSK